MTRSDPSLLTTDDLLRGLELDRVDDTTWHGDGLVMPGATWVFGGIVAAQALAAAAHTAPGRVPRSVRIRFLRQIGVDHPIRHRVMVVSDSTSFADRLVVVTAADDDADRPPLATITVVFHTPDDTDLGHQHTMPDVPPPEAGTVLAGAGFESIDLNDPPTFAREASSPTQRHWMRGPGTPPDDPIVNAAMLAMATDIFLVQSAWRPVEGLSIRDMDRVMTFGLDLTVWIHHPATLADWHLIDADTPSAANGRSLSLANWYRRDGLLVASAVLDSVMRIRGPRRAETDRSS